jgi:hypothetical protein
MTRTMPHNQTTSRRRRRRRRRIHRKGLATFVGILTIGLLAVLIALTSVNMGTTIRLIMLLLLILR